MSLFPISQTFASQSEVNCHHRPIGPPTFICCMQCWGNIGLNIGSRLDLMLSQVGLNVGLNIESMLQIQNFQLHYWKHFLYQIATCSNLGRSFELLLKYVRKYLLERESKPSLKTKNCKVDFFLNIAFFGPILWKEFPWQAIFSYIFQNRFKRSF